MTNLSVINFIYRCNSFKKYFTYQLDCQVSIYILTNKRYEKWHLNDSYFILVKKKKASNFRFVKMMNKQVNKNK